MVVIAHAIQNQPNIPPQPSSIEPLMTLIIPVGSNITTTSTGVTTRNTVTSSPKMERGKPGCTKYQWPNNIASLTAPRKIVPTAMRAKFTAVSPGPTAESNAATTSPTAPTAGATRSQRGFFRRNVTSEITTTAIDDTSRTATKSTKIPAAAAPAANVAKEPRSSQP